MQYIEKAEIKDSFWKQKLDLVASTVLPYQWEILNDKIQSHCIENFKIAAGLSQEERQGVVFLDSDLYKWLEAVGCFLMQHRNKKLKETADWAIELISKAQMPNGYLNTWYQLYDPDGKWANLMESHELYCAGHLFEAAVAYAKATGEETLLIVACRFADHIFSVFSSREGYPGHPEIELALFRLYEYTKCEKYRLLAQIFIDRRGSDGGAFFQKEKDGQHFKPIWKELQDFDATYFLAHKAVREQTVATGHAVRAMYLYTSLADYALLDPNSKLRETCLNVWTNSTERQMFITGGLGSSAVGERFTSDWDLSGDTAYCESCASVALIQFARRMWLLTGDPNSYAVLQRALENNVLASMGKDGKHFFYVNPLEVEPKKIHANPSLAHVMTQRQKWFGVACCPPNIARCLLTLPQMIYAENSTQLFVLLHIASSCISGNNYVELSESAFGYSLVVTGPERKICFRVPENSRLIFETVGIYSENGYACYMHNGGRSEIKYKLINEVKFIKANPKVSALSGKVCVMAGSTVYCAEEADNGEALSALRVTCESLPFVKDGIIKVKGYRETGGDFLYSGSDSSTEGEDICLIPYRDWGNRGEGEMRVWLTLGKDCFERNK